MNGDPTSTTPDDFDDDQINFVAPIPPHERQWRHPSELRGQFAPRISAPPVHREFRLVAIGSACISVVISLALLGVVSPRSPSAESQARGEYIPPDRAAFQMAAGSTSIEDLRSVIPHLSNSSQPVLAMPQSGYFLSSAVDLNENSIIDIVGADGQSNSAQVVAIDQDFGIAWLRRLNFAPIYAAETDALSPQTTVLEKIAHGDLVWVVDRDVTAAIIGLSTKDLAVAKHLWPVDSPPGTKLSGLAVDEQGVAIGWCVFVNGAQWIVPMAMLENILKKIDLTLSDE
ncbi:MAG: hypothetical protein ABIQ38_05930 [Ilumatobacteraceae bacterium]